MPAEFQTSPALLPPKRLLAAPAGFAAPRRSNAHSGYARGVAIAVGVALLLAAASLLMPWDTTYDPWAWIVWGREILHLDLRTTGGPSWKPLPVLFTTPFALAGSAAPALWLVVGRAGGLLAIAAAYAAGRRLAGPVAAVGAALALVLNVTFDRIAWLGSSEGLLVAAVLAAVERHAAGQRRLAFSFGVAAALLRPEVWPFLALYGAWLAWRDPRARPLVGGSAILVAFLWLAPELWGSGQLLRSADRALDPVAAAATFAPDPALEVVKRAQAMLIGPVEAAALAGLAFALARRRTTQDWLVVGLAALAIAWLALVAVMTAHGFSGNTRYVTAPMAIVCVIAGVGAARASEVLQRLMRRARMGPALAAALASGLLAAGLVPFATASARDLGVQIAQLDYQAQMRTGLERAITVFGGRSRVRACGQPVTEDYSVPMLAWDLRVHTSQVGLNPPAHGVIFQARPGPASALDPRIPANASRFEFASGPFLIYARCRN